MFIKMHVLSHLIVLSWSGRLQDQFTDKQQQTTLPSVLYSEYEC